MPKFRTKPQKPQVPGWMNYAFTVTTLISLIVPQKEHPVWHGFFSVAPLFLILLVMKARLHRQDLGSVMICVSFLAEAFSHFFHQFAHDERLFNIYFFEHLCCCIFYALGNIFYVSQVKSKPLFKKDFIYSLPPFMGSLPLLMAGYKMHDFAVRQESKSYIIYYGMIIYVLCLTSIVILALFRINKTSRESFYLGMVAGIFYYLSDILYASFHFKVIEEVWTYKLFFKVMHKFSLFIQLHASMSHIQWLDKKPFKLS